jgi:hypothetical protein
MHEIMVIDVLSGSFGLNVAQAPYLSKEVRQTQGRTVATVATISGGFRLLVGDSVENNKYTLVSMLRMML